MDTITHGLAGAVIAKAGFSQRLGREATVAGVVGAVFPDIDFVFSLLSPMAALQYHRGFTHSLIGMALISIGLGALIRALFKRGRVHSLSLVAFLGGLSHIFFDLITSFGTLVFYPFNTVRYALDWVFILDPVLTGILLSSLLIMKGRPWVPRAALMTLGLYLGIAALNQRVALAQFRDLLQSRGIVHQRVAALPRPLGPLRWAGLAYDNGTVYRASFNTLATNQMELKRFDSSPANRYILAARELVEVKLFRWFARFPLETYEKQGDLHVVEYTDIRFRLEGRRNPFLLRVILDNQGRVVSVRF